jgi:hypothetical protein
MKPIYIVVIVGMLLLIGIATAGTPLATSWNVTKANSDYLKSAIGTTAINPTADMTCNRVECLVTVKQDNLVDSGMVISKTQCVEWAKTSRGRFVRPYKCLQYKTLTDAEITAKVVKYYSEVINGYASSLQAEVAKQ